MILRLFYCVHHIFGPANRILKDFYCNMVKANNKQIIKMSLANLKGNRTRYRNYIEKDMVEIRNLLAVETGSIDIQAFINEIDRYIQKLNGLSEKLDTACAALSIEASNQDRDQEYEQFIEEDNRFATTIIDCISELERRKREAKEMIVTEKKIYRLCISRTGGTTTDTTRPTNASK